MSSLLINKLDILFVLFLGRILPNFFIILLSKYVRTTFAT
ncbi:hypothetical protein SAMN04488097_0055 [Epilithonimonas lactis]|nr:hypothetical protein SAMN04488097_0055 [Epilithonimonas lactis]